MANKIHTHNIESREYRKQILGLDKEDLKKIKDMLKDNGITMQDVSNDCELSITWISDVLNGKKGISKQGRDMAAKVIKSCQKLNREYLEKNGKLLCEQVKQNKIDIKEVESQQSKLNKLLSKWRD